MQAVGVERGAEHVGEDGRSGAGGAEVGKKSGMIPVGYRRHDLLFEIAQHGGKRFSLLRRMRRQSINQLAGLDGGQTPDSAASRAENRRSSRRSGERTLAKSST